MKRRQLDFFIITTVLVVAGLLLVVKRRRQDERGRKMVGRLQRSSQKMENWASKSQESVAHKILEGFDVESFLKSLEGYVKRVMRGQRDITELRDKILTVIAYLRDTFKQLAVEEQICEADPFKEQMDIAEQIYEADPSEENESKYKAAIQAYLTFHEELEEKTKEQLAALRNAVDDEVDSVLTMSTCLCSSA
jgi:hypothetical protein